MNDSASTGTDNKLTTQQATEQATEQVMKKQPTKHTQETDSSKEQRLQEQDALGITVKNAEQSIVTTPNSEQDIEKSTVQDTLQSKVQNVLQDTAQSATQTMTGNVTRNVTQNIAISPEQLELLDVLDETGLPTGEQKTRFDVHKTGLWHRSLHLWIVREEEGVFYVLLQRRSKKKDLEGGRVDVTVGGHFAAGESFVDVLREAEEEIGLKVSPVELQYLHTQQAERFYSDDSNLQESNLQESNLQKSSTEAGSLEANAESQRIDREFQEVYFCQCDQDLSEYFLNPEEVDILYEIPLDAAIELYDVGEPILVAGYDSQSRNNNAMLIEDDLIGQARANTLASLKAIKATLLSTAEKLTN